MSDRSIALRRIYIKFFHWEYWPFGIVQLPAIVYYLWLSLKARTFLFFSASNPGIEMGGMFGESKFEVLKRIPAALIPKTVLIKLPTTTEDVMSEISRQGFSLPVIFKPDIGERGYRVKRIDGETEIAEYVSTAPYDFLVQELVTLPMEFGVFYARHPGKENGQVTSIVMKEMLSVVGDGDLTLRQLILKEDRALLQWEKLKQKFSADLGKIIPVEKVVELVSIGNHALGTKFLNGNHLINGKMNETFDNISKQIDGFYFGRFDLRCESIGDLQTGNFKILELNGCGAEPAHIYDPDFKLLSAMIVLVKHWKTIFEIARQNKKKGVDYIRLKEARIFYRKFKEAIR
jgi:hypothetical protein